MTRHITGKMVWLIISICLVFLTIWGVTIRLMLPHMWNFLVVNEEPKKSDAIIVLSGDNGRIEYGVQLYQMGYADKIIVAGGGSGPMRRTALSMGVPDEDILTEARRSHTTFENALNTLSVVRERGFESVIVVTSAYHTKRAGIIFNEVFQGLDVTVSAAPYDESSADTWWKNRRTASLVISEYLKLVWHYLFERV